MKDQYEQGALVKRALGYRLRWLVWVSIATTFGWASVVGAQDAGPPVLATDNSDANNFPMLLIQDGLSDCTSDTNLPSGYNYSRSTGTHSGYYNKRLYANFPDRAPLAASSHPVTFAHYLDDGIYKNLPIVALCAEGDVTRNEANVTEVSLSKGQSCSLYVSLSNGSGTVSGTLSLTTDASTPTDADYYYKFVGTCVSDETSASAPVLASITRTTGDAAGSTEASVTWIVRFSENVSDVDATDFEISGASGMALSVKKAEGEGDLGYEVTASGGDFTDGNPAYLKLSANNDIKEVNGTQQKLEDKEGFPFTNDNYYCYESCTSATTTGEKTKVETSKGVLTSLKEEDISTFATDKPADMNFDLGTYSYKVENLSTTAADTVTITLTLANDVPADAKIYKVTSSNYIELGSANNLVINGKTVKFDITDNGALDADNTLGVIADPVTVGTPSSTTGTGTTATTTTTSSGSGSVGIIGLLFGSALFGLAVYRRRARSA